MKYAVILFDGMADYPDENGETPMSLAYKPTVDKLAQTARVGLCRTVPPALKPGSDVANLSVLGYDPRICYTGRSPLEAISIGIPLKDDSVTYRANLVTLSNEEPYENKTMLDYSAGEISTEEARTLVTYLAEQLNTPAWQLYAGVSYRHCLKHNGGKTGAVLTPPHDISDRKIARYLPHGENGDYLLRLMKRSYELLRDHPVNRARTAQGKNSADSLWFWGEGTKPTLRDFKQLCGLNGAMISAVDLLKGIAIGAGLESIDVDGATGNVHTNFTGKAQAAAAALKTHDFVYIHLEAPDECGHQGDKAGKIRAIELIDRKIVQPVLATLQQIGEDFKILILPDHATPYTLKTHTGDPVPYLLYESATPHAGVRVFTEKTAALTGNFVEYGFYLINELTGKTING